MNPIGDGFGSLRWSKYEIPRKSVFLKQEGCHEQHGHGLQGRSYSRRRRGLGRRGRGRRGRGRRGRARHRVKRSYLSILLHDPTRRNQFHHSFLHGHVHASLENLP